MEEIFIDLQIAIQEGSDLDLKNEDCHVLNNYLDSKLSKIKELEERTEFQTENNNGLGEVLTEYGDKIAELQKENKQLESEVKDYRERLGLRI